MNPRPDRPRRPKKRRRPVPAQYARTPQGWRVRVWEFTACGEPLPWPEVLSHTIPPCGDPDAEDVDDTLLRYDATDPNPYVLEDN